MEMILFCGIQGSGKTTFYIEKFFRTHMRISLDQLNTRNKESVFIKTCLELQQRLVIDNTNPTKKERSRYIQMAKSKKFRVIGYYFDSPPQAAIERNLKRTGKERIPEVGIRGTYNRLEAPGPEEGFDELFKVEIIGNDFFVSSL